MGKVSARFYGLVYLEQGAPAHAAGPGSSASTAYVALAGRLAQSMNARGVPFTALTNDAEGVARHSRQLGNDWLNATEVPFPSSIPGGVAFRSAPRKLDLFPQLASGRFGDYVALVDLDMILLRDFPEDVGGLFAADMPCVYDITDQVIPAYGAARVHADLRAITAGGAVGPLPRWYGGEFIAGRPEFFARLVETIEAIYQRYRERWRELHHLGDEMIVSAALNLLAGQGIPFEDVGVRQAVGRWWSGTTHHPRRNFEWFDNCALLQLPVDKHFLSTAPSRKAFTRKTSCAPIDAVLPSSTRCCAWGTGSCARDRPRRRPTFRLLRSEATMPNVALPTQAAMSRQKARFPRFATRARRSSREMCGMAVLR